MDLSESIYPTTPCALKQISCISQGIVLIRKALTEEQQIWLAEYAYETGQIGQDCTEGSKSFYKTENGKLVYNSAATRGRIYDALANYNKGEVLSAIATTFANIAKEADPSLPDFNPTHLLLLYYGSKSGIGWHSDSGANDGDNDHPIVSISIGNTSIFGMKINGVDPTTISLESGDILVWGGPQRMLVHTIKKVEENTCPEFLKMKNGRFNFTFRDAPNVLGREGDFAYFYNGEAHTEEKVYIPKEQEAIGGHD